MESAAFSTMRPLVWQCVPHAAHWRRRPWRGRGGAVVVKRRAIEAPFRAAIMVRCRATARAPVSVTHGRGRRERPPKFRTRVDVHEDKT